MEQVGTGWTALGHEGRWRSDLILPPHAGVVTAMTSMPPEPPPWPSDMPRRRRMSTVRIVCGLLWGSIAIICAAGSVGEWLIGVHGGAILCLVIAVGSGWYDYRVWTSRSRRLIV
jgi:hypothetical protein